MSSPSLGQMPLIPINDCVLVKLGQQYNNFSTAEGKYDTRTNGIVVAIPKRRTDLTSVLEGRRVYFEEYKEGARIKRDNEQYCFIKIDDIRGYEEVTENEQAGN